SRGEREAERHHREVVRADVGDDAREERRHAHRRLWTGRPAGRGGDDHTRDLPVTARVVLYVGRGCHLCERARETLEAEGVGYEAVDITGDPALEEAYREWVPVLEIDGQRAFVYRIPVDALRRKLGAQS